MIYKLVYQFNSPLWHESPWVGMHPGWSPHPDRKTCTCTRTHAHTHTHTHTQRV